MQFSISFFHTSKSEFKTSSKNHSPKRFFKLLYYMGISDKEIFLLFFSRRKQRKWVHEMNKKRQELVNWRKPIASKKILAIHLE